MTKARREVGLAARFVRTLLIAGVLVLSMYVTSADAGTVARSTGSTSSATHRWVTQSSPSSQALFAVSCFDASRCKAVGAGGTLLYTKNGGATWRVQHNPFAGSSTILYRIECVGRSTCYVIGRPNIVLVTHNGGVTWSTSRFTLPGSNGQLTDPACVSSQDADLRARLAVCRLGLLDLACINVDTCFVVATFSRQLGTLTSAVFLTTNGGSTWKGQQIPATEPCVGPCGHPPPPEHPYPLNWITCKPGLPCRAGGSVWLDARTGNASLVIGTSKPGAPWTPIGHLFPYSSAPDSAVCTTITRCYGVWTTDPFASPRTVWVSTDGGANWTSGSSGTPRIRNAIACPGARTCYSVGNQGTITASTNGSPFVSQQSPISHDLYGITCVDVTTCFAVGNKGTIVARR